MTSNTLVQATTSWWCSDGTFLMKADTTNHGSGSTDQSFLGAVADYASGKEALLNVKAANDRRLELFYQACRQKDSICGATLIPETPTSATDLTNQKRTIQTTTGGFESGEKCTWVMRSK